MLCAVSSHFHSFLLDLARRNLKDAETIDGRFLSSVLSFDEFGDDGCFVDAESAVWKFGNQFHNDNL